MSDLIKICKLLDKQLGPILRHREFVLLEMNGRNEPGDKDSTNAVIRYGELVRKFKKVEQKRFLEIVLTRQLGNSHLRFGKGSHSYCDYDLPGWPIKSVSANEPILKDHIIKLMIEKAQYFVGNANEFFANTPEFWESLGKK